MASPRIGEPSPRSGEVGLIGRKVDGDGDGDFNDTSGTQTVSIDDRGQVSGRR
jgi:hypothetical protein